MATPREVMTAYLDAARSGDWDTARTFMADDLVIHVPGSAAFAGDRQGKEHAIEYIQTIRERFAGRIELELIDMLVSDERVTLLVLERFLTDGPPIEIRRANVYRVEGDHIAEVSIFEADQYVVDEMLH